MTPERRYLAERARLAKADLRAEANGVAEAALAPLQLRELVRRHPRLAVGGGALLGMLLVRTLRGPRTQVAAAPSASWSAALAHRVRRLLGSTFGALWLSGLRSPPATPPPSDASTDAAVRSARRD
ncbi:MAG: hypothetical protein MUC36_06280 [Planctomycetes bacterium]|jgi:hypothetical protein|nr:hypothetical protein [Planctomycetota bacterium]